MLKKNIDISQRKEEAADLLMTAGKVMFKRPSTSQQLLSDQVFCS